MPQPASKLSTQDFTDRCIDSGVISRDQVLGVIAAQPYDQRPADGEQLAKLLVRDQKLTLFQAQHIYAGKGKSLRMGSYTIIDKLGEGGMGIVYKALHRRMNRLVALKVLGRKALESPDAVHRFQREVKAAAKLSHPNIVTAYDADEADGRHFLAMEFVPGTDLASLVQQQGRLPVEQAIDLVIQAARGLEYAHGKGIIHRDIKPANLLLDEAGVVKILDMGLARFETPAAETADLTNTGQIMGTVDYMAPEQALDTRQAAAPADIYSLGVTLWYLLTARPLFGGETLLARLVAHRDTPIPTLAGVRSDIPAGLEIVFNRMVAKRPEQRFASMTEVIAALTHCRQLEPSAPNITAPPAPALPDETQVFPGPTSRSQESIPVPSVQEKKNPAAITVAVENKKKLPTPASSRRRKSPLRDPRVLTALAMLTLAIGVTVVITLRRDDRPAVRSATANTRPPRKAPAEPLTPNPSSPTATPDPASSSRRSVMTTDSDRAVAQWVLEIGGSLQLYDPANPNPPLEYPITKLDQLPATQFEIYRVNLGGNQRVTDADLAKFDGLKHLNQLGLRQTATTNDGLNRLGELPALWEIHIADTKVDPAGVRSLVRFPILGSLNVSRIPLTDDDAKFLSERMPNLSGVFASGTWITDVGFRTLLSNPQFRAGAFSGIGDQGIELLRNRQNIFVLQLTDCRVTRKGVEAIATCPNLYELFLSGSKAIDDGCVTELAKLTKLTRLRLDGTSITDACVDDLLKLTNLKLLYLPKGNFTPAALARLRDGLPNCDVKEQ